MTFISLVPSIYTNVKQYGALGDGKTVTDGAITTGTPTLTSATAAFTAADVGKLITVNGANTDLFSAQTSLINVAATGGTGIAGTLYNFGVYDMTLDGNRANQTAGPSYPLRFYGYSYIMQNLIVRNGYNGNVLSDYNAP